MQRSERKILTTHVGSLPFLLLDQGVAIGDQSNLIDDVAAIIVLQRDLGIDIINEGEYAKAATGCAICRTVSAASLKYPRPTKSR